MDNDLFSEKVKIKLEENRKYIKSMLISLDELESKIKKL